MILSSINVVDPQNQAEKLAGHVFFQPPIKNKFSKGCCWIGLNSLLCLNDNAFRQRPRRRGHVLAQRHVRALCTAFVGRCESRRLDVRRGGAGSTCSAGVSVSWRNVLGGGGMDGDGGMGMRSTQILIFHFWNPKPGGAWLEKMMRSDVVNKT